MNEQRLQAMLAALLRESGRTGPGPVAASVGACVLSVDLARTWLSNRPSLAGLADAVATEIESGAEAAYARLGFQYTSQAADASAADPATLGALLPELDRIPDGPADCILAALLQLLAVHFGTQPASEQEPRVLAGWHDLARLNAALADALLRTGPTSASERPLLFVRGELIGLDEQIFGSAENRFVPADKPALIGRAYRSCYLGGAVARRLLLACDAPELAQLALGHGRFLLLVPNLPETVERLRGARAEIERDLLRQFEGVLSPCISLTDGALDELSDFAALRRRLDAGHRRRAGTPFLDALESEAPFGPFGTEMEDEQSVRSHAGPHRELGTGLKSARFGIEHGSWPPRFDPLADEAALAAAMSARPEGSARVEWPGTREGLWAALKVSAQHGGRILLGPSSTLPVQCEVDPSVPLATAVARIRPLAPDPPDPHEAIAARGLLGWMHGARLIDELTRASAAGLAQGRSITIITGSGSRVVAVGPLKAMLSFVGRLQSRLDEVLGPHQAALDVGLAVRSVRGSQSQDGRSPFSFATQVRQAREALIELGSARRGPGRCWLFGAEVATAELAHLQQLGDELALLSAREPSRVLALLEAAVRIGRGGDAMPLSEVSRLRAKIHQLAARLGVNARVVERDGREDSGETRALKELILNFDRMFDSGAARVPLAYAVALSESQARELSS